jgi:TetR/AcrR family transcriptional regulator, transcriptional repressor for nem operon
MAHPLGRKERTRLRILQAAARLFATQGFEATRIESVMHECGLTRGGFYAHFRSKAHLHEEAGRMMSFAAQAASQQDWLESLFAACTSGVSATAWASMSADVASPSHTVRRQYRHALETLLAKLASPPAPRKDQDAVLAHLAMLIGVLSISATIDDARLRDALVGACRSALHVQDATEEPSFFWALDRPLIYALQNALQSPQH